ncbi:hypothetical protein [Epilithonimonas arachidiradicis]|uniref:Lipoprotein n=1 Tax=Epilithonimonas arachidiradicis TaxID=1617282 RepID=A0A420CXQ5_9FLAO|nr:hypothetical protein [Epilithonimonas arachidiradicis]RKE83253.1 hypothetical protein BXY58_2808 [Epilithonimonas arachidiradicis]GGG65989.1 hypothetical protein GCM10007332_30780 [Epilithonimonas arachidiradicis]
MKSKFFQIILITLFAFQSCKKETEQENLSKTEVQKPKDTVKSTIVEKPEKELQSSIEVSKIDSLEYLHFEIKNNINKKKLTKITDFNQAKKLLKGIVEFDENPDFGANPAVKKIHFRDGKEYGNTNEYDYYFFIAYYPEEDILLCEGGHTTDISFNLKNGKETEETGNPDYINFSPSGKFRLNGHFGGQECSSYFIQKKIGNDYVKIIQLDEEFEKLTKIWLCIVGESFWADDHTLFLTESSNFGKAKKYFKVKLIEK